jgi:hypothetical protein
LGRKQNNGENSKENANNKKHSKKFEIKKFERKMVIHNDFLKK